MHVHSPNVELLRRSILIVLVVVTAAISGCTDSQPRNQAASESPGPSTSASPQPELPPVIEKTTNRTIGRFSMDFPVNTGGKAYTFVVPNGTIALYGELYANATASGPYVMSSQGGVGKGPVVAAYPPGWTIETIPPLRFSLNSDAGVADAGETVQGPLQDEAAGPAEGEWETYVSGHGHNVLFDLVVRVEVPVE